MTNTRTGSWELVPFAVSVRAGRLALGLGVEPAFWAALFGVDEAVAVRESTLIRDVVRRIGTLGS